MGGLGGLGRLVNVIPAKSTVDSASSKVKKEASLLGLGLAIGRTLIPLTSSSAITVGVLCSNLTTVSVYSTLICSS